MSVSCLNSRIRLAKTYIRVWMDTHLICHLPEPHRSRPRGTTVDIDNDRHWSSAAVLLEVQTCPLIIVFPSFTSFWCHGPYLERSSHRWANCFCRPNMQTEDALVASSYHWVHLLCRPTVSTTPCCNITEWTGTGKSIAEAGQTTLLPYSVCKWRNIVEDSSAACLRPDY